MDKNKMIFELVALKLNKPVDEVTEMDALYYLASENAERVKIVADTTKRLVDTFEFLQRKLDALEDFAHDILLEEE